jgi:hypothetical protein
MFERLAIGIALVGVACSQALAVSVAAPGPVLGAGLSGLAVAGVGIYAWYRNRK